MKKCFTLFILLLSCWSLHAQSITKTSVSPVSGTVCPGFFTYYDVSVPSHLTNCEIVWSATNGIATRDASDQRKATVVWSDIPGATGTVTATFTNCSDQSNNGVTASKSELILSIKNQAWGSYGNSINIDFCTTEEVTVIVPRMFVQGTGGIAQPPLTEVIYGWTVPDKWREVGTHRTGFFGTTGSSITIEPKPNECAWPGQVTVQGLLNDASRCASAAASSTATISLNGANPVATVGAQPGFAGVTACNTTPVTFYATTSVALGCISSYNWAYPPSWSYVSHSGNSITLQPSGTPDDSKTIKATINFSCGSSITSGGYTPPYIAPVISGPNLICTSGSYSVQNASGVSVTWSSSNTNIATINSSGTVTRVSNAIGEVTLTATFPCDVPPVTKTIWVGKPTYSGVTIVRDINDPNQNISYVYGYSNSVQFYVSLASGVGNYQWTITSDQSCGSNYTGPKFYSNGNGTQATTTNNKINVNTGTCPGTFWIQCKAVNTCGETYYSQRLFKVASNPGGGCDYSITTYPNPSQVDRNVTINLVPPPPGCDNVVTLFSSQETTADSTDEISSISITDNSGNPIYRETSSGSSHIFSTENLKQGVYYLKVQTVQGRSFKTRIVKD